MDYQNRPAFHPVHESSSPSPSFPDKLVLPGLGQPLECTRRVRLQSVRSSSRSCCTKAAPGEPTFSPTGDWNRGTKCSGQHGTVAAGITLLVAGSSAALWTKGPIAKPITVCSLEHIIRRSKWRRSGGSFRRRGLEGRRHARLNHVPSLVRPCRTVIGSDLRIGLVSCEFID